MGELAVLVTELDVDPAAWARAFRAASVDGVVEVVPAAETVLVVCADAASLAAVAESARMLRPAASVASRASVVEIPTRYDGPDLAAVADTVGMAVGAVIDAHTRATYSVAFCGFAPGFAYLVGLDHRLHLPRRSTPRTSVPAGSVAIADRYAAVYPRASPGGWHLLGSTALTLFDPDRTPPALLEPGMHVRFVAT
jgi:KipI family sensor histidine kinase inhibitor